MKFIQKLLSYTVLSTIVALIIFYLSCLIPQDDIPVVDFEFPIPIPIDKIVHFCMYFGLSSVIAWNYIWVKKGEIIYLKLIIFVILLPILYGGIIELLQGEYFNRTADWEDFLANTIGVLVSVPISLKFKNYIKRKYNDDNL